MITQNGAIKAYDIDTKYMRIIAACFVVLLHSSGMDSTAAVFLNAISRFAVPLFVIISGYYMLAKEKKIIQIVKKCTVLFLKMLVWSGIYYVYGVLCKEQYYSGTVWLLKYLLTEPVHLWYCYATIALYLVTPVLYVFSKNATPKEYRYAILLTFIFGSVVVLLLRSNMVPLLAVIVERMKMPYLLGFVCLYLFGGYMNKYGIASKTHRIILYLLGTAGTFVSFVGTLFAPAWNLPNDLFLSFFAPNTVLAGAACFVLMQQGYRFCQNKLQKLRPIICGISECTLGIYLLHPLILKVLQRLDLSLLIVPKAALAFLVSLILVAIVKRMPVLKHLV